MTIYLHSFSFVVSPFNENASETQLDDVCPVLPFTATNFQKTPVKHN